MKVDTLSCKAKARGTRPRCRSLELRSTRTWPVGSRLQSGDKISGSRVVNRSARKLAVLDKYNYNTYNNSCNGEVHFRNKPTNDETCQLDQSKMELDRENVVSVSLSPRLILVPVATN